MENRSQRNDLDQSGFTAEIYGGRDRRNGSDRRSGLERRSSLGLGIGQLTLPLFGVGQLSLPFFTLPS